MLGWRIVQFDAIVCEMARQVFFSLRLRIETPVWLCKKKLRLQNVSNCSKPRQWDFFKTLIFIRDIRHAYMWPWIGHTNLGNTCWSRPFKPSDFKKNESFIMLDLIALCLSNSSTMTDELGKYVPGRKGGASSNLSWNSYCLNDSPRSDNQQGSTTVWNTEEHKSLTMRTGRDGLGEN